MFVALRRQGKPVSFSRGKRECDFLVVEGTNIIQAIQVCTTLNAANQERELGGLTEVLAQHPQTAPLLLTANQRKTLKLPGSDRKVNVMPVWRWVLDE